MTSATNIANDARRGRGAAGPRSPRSLRPRPLVPRRRRRRSSRRGELVGAHSPATSRSIGLRVRNTWSGRPFSTISRYRSETLEQLVVRAVGDELAVLEHHDLVGQRDRRQPVGDDERRAARHDLAQRVLDLLLGRRVDRRRRVVEDQDPRVGQERARDRDALALAAAERQPALADARVVALRAARSMKPCACARRAASSTSSQRRVRPRVGDVVAHATR